MYFYSEHLNILLKIAHQTLSFSLKQYFKIIPKNLKDDELGLRISMLLSSFLNSIKSYIYTNKKKKKMKIVLGSYFKIKFIKTSLKYEKMDQKIQNGGPMFEHIEVGV